MDPIRKTSLRRLFHLVILVQGYRKSRAAYLQHAEIKTSEWLKIVILLATAIQSALFNKQQHSCAALKFVDDLGSGMHFSLINASAN